MALRRQQESLIKVPANNLYYAAMVFAFMIDPPAAIFLLGIAALVLVFPLSADPLRLIPRSRLQLWPVTVPERRLLRLISPWLNPITWLVVAVVLWRRVATDLAAVLAGLFLTAFLAPAFSGKMPSVTMRWVPRIPGTTGQLIRKNLRGLLTTLDFYCALIPGAGAAGYRLAGLLPSDAALPLTWIVLLCISTCAQTLFGLDGRAGMTRYRLMPLRGWQMLLAKDLAFLAVSLVLTAALSPLAGLAGSLVSLAIVRRAAIVENRAQIRWRLQAGTSFGVAITQMILMVAAASWAHAKGPLVLIPCILAWAVSLWWGGRLLDEAAN
jgi:hypothetical protein